MGYTLKIESEILYDDNKLGTYFQQTVENVELDEAPSFGEPTDNSNARWPSYTSWAEACRFLDIYDLFFDEKVGIIREHPGCVPINEAHKKVIDEAYDRFKEKYPNAEPGYSHKLDWPDENNWGTRIVWLKFWVDWALDNCKVPAFYNS